jgi:hypothetical protein
MMPAKKYPSASQSPPQTSQMMLSNVFIRPFSPERESSASGIALTGP